MYVLEIVAHLVWCYIFLTFVGSLPWLVLFALVQVWQGQELTLDVLPSSSFLEWIVRVAFGSIHIWIFLTFRSTVWPRFMSYSPLLTFSLSSVLGSLMVGCLQTVLLNEFLSLSTNLAFMFAMSLFAGLIDRFQYWMGPGMGAPLWPWFGRLLVGRRNFDAFVEWDGERMHTSYETYVEDLRRRHGQGG